MTLSTNDHCTIETQGEIAPVTLEANEISETEEIEEIMEAANILMTMAMTRKLLASNEPIKPKIKISLTKLKAFFENYSVMEADEDEEMIIEEEQECIAPGLNP